jgi:hypothetical protein
VSAIKLVANSDQLAAFKFGHAQAAPALGGGSVRPWQGLTLHLNFGYLEPTQTRASAAVL